MFAMLLILATASTTAQDDNAAGKRDQALLNRLKRDYPAAAKTLRAQTQNVELTIKRSFRELSGRVTTSQARLLRKGASTLREALINPGAPGSLWRVMCVSGGRSFVLEKRPGASAYQLTPMQVGGGPKIEDLEFDPEMEHHVGQFVTCAYTLAGRDLATLLNSPSFQIRDLAERREDNRSVIRLTYSWAMNHETLTSPVEGWIDLCPDLNWAILAWEARTTTVEKLGGASVPYVGTHKCVLTYEKVGTEIRLRTSRSVATVSTDASRQEDQVEVVDYKSGQVVDRDFTLEAFGVKDNPNP